ncbi:nucleoside recognition domain-containing protein [Zongyangia sp. HA2173]|uniref:spore maturation protein n=1 Tax=Zongyangia sp. HA2173 TaxID=3133035 RepID=UPI003165DEF8
MTDYIIPAIIVFIVVYALIKGVPVFDVFISGAKEGFGTATSVLPALIGLMTAIGMFKASGALDMLTAAIRPLAQMVHIPPEVVPLAIVRPISGSGALAVFQDILKSYGPDSLIGQVASVMQGSTETTFYTIAVYYGVTKVQRTRHTLASSLVGDVTGFFMSALTVQLILR